MIPVIDMHCDTMSILHDRQQTGETIHLDNNGLHIDLKKMQNSEYLCQNFALFTYLGAWQNNLNHYQGGGGAGAAFPGPKEYALSLSDTFDREITANKDSIRPVLTASDIRKNHQAGYMSALKTIEEGAVYEGNADNLRLFYNKGVRMTTLTWNFENQLAFPNKFDWTSRKVIPDTENGLKLAGKTMVEACFDMGIIVDISHLNDAGIHDIFDMAGKRHPIVASHSNARAVTDHARNLTDDMLKKLADCGGVTGINFCSAFINDRSDNMTLIDDMICHIRHIEDIAGIESIGLGSDFDGIENKIEFENCGGMQRLAEGLEQAGYSMDAIEKIFYRNVLRVYEEVL